MSASLGMSLASFGPKRRSARRKHVDFQGPVRSQGPLQAALRLRRQSCGGRPCAADGRGGACRRGSAVEPGRRCRRPAGGFPGRCAAPAVPQDRRRLDGDGGDLVGVPVGDRPRGLRPGRGAGEEGPQGRLHPHHLRHPHHHGPSDGLLFEARPQRRSGEDGRLGGDPRQVAGQGIRRRAHALADAARHFAGRRLESGAVDDAGDREHQRSGDHARQQAQGQAQPEGLEGLPLRRAVRLLDAQLPAALLRGRAWPRP